MQIVEFFGLPYSGKSYYTNLCKTFFKKKKIYNIKSIFYYYLLEKKKINFMYFLMIMLSLQLNLRTKKLLNINTKKQENKNSKIKKKKKLFFKSFFNINREKYKLFSLSRKKFEDFYNICTEIIDNEISVSRKKNLHRWLVDELNAFYLAKNSKLLGVMIISEGFIQRLHSYYLNKNEIDINIIKKYFHYLPKSNYTFYIKSDINKIKTRLQQFYKFEKEKFYYQNIEILNKKMNQIYKQACITNEVYLVEGKNTFENIFNKNHKE